MILRIFPALAIIVICAPEHLAAQEFAAGSPEAAVTKYVEALAAGDIDLMAQAMHPEALATFRATMQPIVDIAEKNEGAASEMLQLFDGVTSIAQLKKLSDTKFFVSFYKGVASLQPSLAEGLREAEIDVLGHIDEGDDLAHVVYRVTAMPDAGAKQTEVVSLRRTKTGWGVLLTGEFEGMAESMRQSFEAQQ
jgi:hypothetical protein